MQGMSSFKKFGQNVYYSPYALQIIDIESLQFPKLKKKINFGPKLDFSYNINQFKSEFGLKRSASQFYEIKHIYQTIH
jgi:hypothetical protein